MRGHEGTWGDMGGTWGNVALPFEPPVAQMSITTTNTF